MRFSRQSRRQGLPLQRRDQTAGSASASAASLISSFAGWRRDIGRELGLLTSALDLVGAIVEVSAFPLVGPTRATSAVISVIILLRRGDLDGC